MANAMIEGEAVGDMPSGVSDAWSLALLGKSSEATCERLSCKPDRAAMFRMPNVTPPIELYALCMRWSRIWNDR